VAICSRGLEKRESGPRISHLPLTEGAKSNILVDSKLTARIADFGLTSFLRHPSISMSVSAPAGGGTCQWMAPELFNENSHPSKQSDIYALGMVVYEVGRIVLLGDSLLMDHS
jgi:serine/threonine protein kinase